MSNKLDLQTVLDFRQGCERAFNRIFKGYHRPIVEYSVRITKNREEAEDITNEVFIKLYNRCSVFDNESHIKSFLYRCAHNDSCNYLKAKRGHDKGYLKLVEHLRGDILLTNDYSITVEIVEKAHREIERLPKKRREIFKLLFLRGLKPAEVAKKLKISVNTVNVQKKRALATLRKKLFPKS